MFVRGRAALPLLLGGAGCTVLVDPEPWLEGAGGGGGVSFHADGGASSVSSASSSPGGSSDGGGAASGGGASGGGGGGAVCPVGVAGSDVVFERVTDGHCYRQVSTEMRWVEAELDCAAWGGYLAKVEEREQAFLEPELVGNSSIWIGARDLDGDGAYSFTVDDTPVMWWKGGQTLFGGGCARLAPPDWQWLGSACNDANVTHYFLCERHPPDGDP